MAKKKSKKSKRSRFPGSSDFFASRLSGKSSSAAVSGAFPKRSGVAGGFGSRWSNTAIGKGVNQPLPVNPLATLLAQAGAATNPLQQVNLDILKPIQNEVVSLRQDYQKALAETDTRLEGFSRSIEKAGSDIEGIRDLNEALQERTTSIQKTVMDHQAGFDNLVGPITSDTSLTKEGKLFSQRLNQVETHVNEMYKNYRSQPVSMMPEPTPSVVGQGEVKMDEGRKTVKTKEVKSMQADPTPPPEKPEEVSMEGRKEVKAKRREKKKETVTAIVEGKTKPLDDSGGEVVITEEKRPEESVGVSIPAVEELSKKQKVPFTAEGSGTTRRRKVAHSKLNNRTGLEDSNMTTRDDLGDKLRIDHSDFIAGLNQELLMTADKNRPSGHNEGRQAHLTEHSSLIPTGGKRPIGKVRRIGESDLPISRAIQKSSADIIPERVREESGQVNPLYLMDPVPVTDQNGTGSIVNELFVDNPLAEVY